MQDIFEAAGAVLGVSWTPNFVRMTFLFLISPLKVLFGLQPYWGRCASCTCGYLCPSKKRKGSEGISKFFARLKDRIIHEKMRERKYILYCAVLLLNCSKMMVGVNLILNTYIPLLSVDSNVVLQKSQNKT